MQYAVFSDKRSVRRIGTDNRNMPNEIWFIDVWSDVGNVCTWLRQYKLVYRSAELLLYEEVKEQPLA